MLCGVIEKCKYPGINEKADLSTFRNFRARLTEKYALKFVLKYSQWRKKASTL